MKQDLPVRAGSFETSVSPPHLTDTQPSHRRRLSLDELFLELRFRGVVLQMVVQLFHLVDNSQLSEAEAILKFLSFLKKNLKRKAKSSTEQKESAVSTQNHQPNSAVNTRPRRRGLV